jgi:hypothetical protein
MVGERHLHGGTSIRAVGTRSRLSVAPALHESNPVGGAPRWRIERDVDQRLAGLGDDEGLRFGGLFDLPRKVGLGVVNRKGLHRAPVGVVLLFGCF